MTDRTNALTAATGALSELVRAAAVLLPDGLVLESTGEGESLDHELLARTCVSCFASSADGDPAGTQSAFVEYVMLTADRVLLLQRGRREPRLALVALCERAANPQLLLVNARLAIATLEAELDPALLDG